MQQRLRIIGLALLLILAGGAAVADDGGSGGGQEARFVGLVQGMPGAGLLGDWSISGLMVHVSASTELKQEDGILAVGATAEVRGAFRMDGSVDASRIEARAGAAPVAQEMHFVGVITGLPASGLLGDWMVGGVTVHVTAATRIEQKDALVSVGGTVEVKGTSEADGSLDAAKIEVRATAPAPPAGAPAPIEFRGEITQLPAGGGPGDWVIGGKTVHVTTATKVNARDGVVPAVGAFAEVHGTLLADGSVDASNIEVKLNSAAAAGGVEFKGTVEMLAAAVGFVGDWTVSGKTVHVSALTRIDTDEGTLAVGSFVEVKGTARPDGSIDATRVELEWGPATSGSALTTNFIIPASAHLAGRNDAFFTTTLTLANPSSTSIVVEIRFGGHDRDGRTASSVGMTLAPRETRIFEDVLGTLLGVSDDFGALRVLSNSSSLIVSSATVTRNGGGSFGQEVPAAQMSDLVVAGRGKSIAGIRQDRSFRTNLVLASASEEPIDADIQLVDREGNQIGTAQVHLQPLEMRQLNDIGRQLGATGDLSESRVILSTATPNGAFAAMASQIDNATNDPRTLLPR